MSDIPKKCLYGEKRYLSLINQSIFYLNFKKLSYCFFYKEEMSFR